MKTVDCYLGFSKESKNANDDSYKAVNTGEGAYNREDDTNYRKTGKESDYNTCNSNNNEKNHKLDNKRNDVSLLYFEACGPNFLDKIHNNSPFIFYIIIITVYFQKCNSFEKFFTPRK